MTTYYMNEGAFELPSGALVDRTRHLLEARTSEHGDVRLLVCRAIFPPGTTLRNIVKSHLKEDAKSLSGHAVIEEREAAWADVPAIEVAARWRGDESAIYQRQAHLALPDTWMYLALSASYEARAACDGWMDQIRSSFRLRSDDQEG